ncbi:type II secretion system F family protein [archaeon]|nr:type II secretion system F family protein [archaeon]
MKNVPLVPIKLKRAIAISKKLGLMAVSSRLTTFLPNLKANLIQGEIDVIDREYLAVALFAALFYLVLVNVFFLVLSSIAVLPSNFYPRLLIIRRIRDLDRNLLFGLRHLLIQVRSGVTLFDSMVSVSNSNYGELSDEFKRTVKKISTGIAEVDALEELALKNPSLFFRRAIWQIANSLRSGADVAKTLESIVNNLASEQNVMMRKYGSQLNPLAFIYMMFGIILPSLGITFMIALSSFMGIIVKQSYFWFLIGFLILFHFNFIGIVKSRRPSVEVYV